MLFYMWIVTVIKTGACMLLSRIPSPRVYFHVFSKYNILIVHTQIAGVYMFYVVDRSFMVRETFWITRQKDQEISLRDVYDIYTSRLRKHSESIKFFIYQINHPDIEFLFFLRMILFLYRCIEAQGELLMLSYVDRNLYINLRIQLSEVGRMFENTLPRNHEV